MIESVDDYVELVRAGREGLVERYRWVEAEESVWMQILDALPDEWSEVSLNKTLPDSVLRRLASSKGFEPDKPTEESAMTPDEYLGRVRATAWRGAEYLPSEPIEEVYRLIDHGEPAEGLCSLAWAIVNAEARVPKDLIDAICEYTSDLIDEEFMPPNLGDYTATEDDPQ